MICSCPFSSDSKRAELFSLLFSRLKNFVQLIIRSCVLVVVAVSVLACSTAVDDEWEDVQQSVIRLHAEDYFGGSTGTAFSLNDDGYYGTNYHVIEQAINGGEVFAIESVSPATKVHPAEIIYTNPEIDFAVVRVESWKNKPLTLLKNEESIRVNLNVLSIGYPGSSDVVLEDAMESPAYTVPTTKQGIISKGIDTPEVRLLEHSAFINSGNSGGPLVDECARVVGVNVAKALSSFDIADAMDQADYSQSQAAVDISEGAFFAINIGEITDVLKAQRIDHLLSGKSCVGEEIGINQLLAVVFALLAVIALSLIAVLVYIKSRYPNQKLTVANVSKVISRPFLPKANSQPEKPAFSVYRGDGGEVIHLVSATFECINGDGPSFTLTPKNSIVIGRDPNQVDIAVLEERVSRCHARIYMTEEGDLFVWDMNSSSGTFIGDQPVSTQAPGTALPAGARLMIGSENVTYVAKFRK